MSFSKFLNLSELQLPHLENGKDKILTLHIIGGLLLINRVERPSQSVWAITAPPVHW